MLPAPMTVTVPELPELVARKPMPPLETEPPPVMESVPVPLMPTKRSLVLVQVLPAPSTVTVLEFPAGPPSWPAVFETTPPLAIASVPVP